MPEGLMKRSTNYAKKTVLANALLNLATPKRKASLTRALSKAESRFTF